MPRGGRGLFDGPEGRDIEIGKSDVYAELTLAKKVMETPVYLICAETLK